MEDRKFNTTVTYNGNCYYNKSSQSQVMVAPLITPTLDVTLINTSNNVADAQGIYYYDDLIKVNVFVESVTYGSFSFYFIDEDDLSQTPQLINQDPINIDIENNAAILFKPHNNGYFKIEYNGEPYYNNTSIEVPISLVKRPVTIEFDDYAPYLVDPEDTIEMKVTVKDENTNESLDYGLVTFLNYHNMEGEEKVIGNPKYLIDGKATINYSPIQLKHSNELLHNIELIRASYNYDNTEYGITWDYYAQNHDYTCVAIKRESQINMYPPYKITGLTSMAPLNISDEALFQATQNDTLFFKCQITLTNPTTTTDSEEIKVTNADVKFIVEGIQQNYDTGSLEEENIKQEFKATYNSKNNCYECYINHIDENNNLSNVVLDGLYRVYAQIDNFKDVNDYIHAVNNASDLNLPSYTNNQAPITDGLYIKSNISESFYIKIAPKKNNNLVLNLENKRTFIDDHKIYRKDLILHFENTDDTDKIALNGKKCYFYFTNINLVSRGTIIYDTDADTLTGQLDILDADYINISYLGDCNIYAYIASGSYTYNNAGNRLSVKKYDKIISNFCPIKIRDTLDITLRKNVKNNQYPGNVQYIIEGNNIMNNDTVKVNVYINDISCGTYYLTDLFSMINQSVPTEVIKGGTNTIRITYGYLENSTPAGEKTIEFDIEKADLEISINDDIKNYIYATVPAFLILDIKHTYGFDINTLNSSDLNISVMHESAPTQTINTEDIELTKVDNGYQAKIKCNLYDGGEWQIQADYKGSDYYNKIENNIQNFTVKNDTPIVENLSLDENTINNIVYNIQNVQYVEEMNGDTPIESEVITYETRNQCVLVLNKITIDDSNPYYFVNVTNANGEYTIKRPKDILEENEWVQYNKLEYQILPKDNIINVFKNIEDVTNNNIIGDFTSYFNDYTDEQSYYVNTDENDNIINLYTQATQNNFVTLFYGYNKTNNTITLFGDDTNGTE